MRLKYLMPLYMKNFKCIGNKCEDTCCSVEWQIGLDKAITRKYLYHPKEKIRSKAKKYIKINDNKELTGHYAYMTAGDQKSGLCGFCEEGLCLIHKELGASELSKTCYIYPRFISSINGKKEMTGLLSCIEVARQVLMTDESMEFIEYEMEMHQDKEHISNLINTNHIFHTEKHEELFWKMRSLIIGLLSCRRYSIEERLILLGLMHQKVQPILDDKAYIKLETILVEFEGILYGENVIELKGLEQSQELQGALVKVVLENKSSIHTKAYMDLIGKVQEGLEKYNKDYIKAYKKASKDYQKYKDRFETILERYLIHYVFQMVYPINMATTTDEFSDFVASYNLLVVHFSIIRMFIMGIYKYNNSNLEDKEIVGIIQAIAKVYTQDRGYLGRITETFKGFEICTIPWMIILLNS